MSRLRRTWIIVFQTLLRVLPFPTRTGLFRMGAPGPGSPVLLTGNFALTVERVRHALKGLDAYLLVANSHGVNVWCAATGGMLTNHDVISVIKTSGISHLVDHRDVILPQLAATGIDGKSVRQRTGWRVIWGPVEAADVAAFLAANRQATPAMRTVTFPWKRRFEMAVAWAFPMSLLALILWPFWPAGVLPLAGLVWGVSLVLFLGFPIYKNLLHTSGRSRGFIIFDFGQRGLPILIWLTLIGAWVVVTVGTGTFSWTQAWRWGLASLVVLLLLGLDLTGSTPVYKSGLHEDRLLAISLDEQRCRGAGFCQQVCPKDVFEIDHSRRLAVLSKANECVQCGACIVQCPFDALRFEGPDGRVVAPETVREFKLNLLGSRQVPPE